MNALQSFETRIWRNRALNRAVRSTYIIWAQSYPVGESALFDSSFVQGELMPFLSRFVDGEPGICVSELVETWAAHVRISGEGHAPQRAALASAVRDFLHIFDGEYTYQCNRRQGTLWYKLWYGTDSTNGQPVPVVAAG